MKKSLILLALPLLMGSITFGNQARSGLSEIKEDTVAHEELFGRSRALKNFGGAIKHNAATLDGAKVGYQIQYNEETDKLAIRYVAAIKDTNVKAVWSRAVAKGDGSEAKAMNHEKESKKYYHSLINGSKVITAGEGSYASYAGFVVYTLYNISYESLKDSYVVAYLTLYDEEDTLLEHGVETTPLAVKFEMNDAKDSSAYEFQVTRDNGYFLHGRVNSMGSVTVGSAASDGNAAEFYRQGFDEEDSFGMFYFTKDKFQYFSYSSFFATSMGFFKESTQNSGFVTPLKNGKFTLYISDDYGNENKVYTTAISFDNPVIDLYIGVDNWGYSDAKYAMWAWGDGHPGEWIEPTKISDTRYKFADFNIGTYTGFKFTRHDKSKDGYEWDGEGKTIWNETGNLSISNLVAVTSIAHIYFENTQTLISWLTYQE